MLHCKDFQTVENKESEIILGYRYAYTTLHFVGEGGGVAIQVFS